MIKFNQIILQDFRSFSGRTTLALDEKGLFLIKGRNLDTSGESGAGKSSILIAIAYALGCSPFSGKDLTNWNAEKAQVILSLTVDHKAVDIYRGIINKIVFEDKEIAGAKQIDEALDGIFGIGANQRATVLYKNQGLGDYFLNKSNSEKRDFIVSALGIDEFEKQITTTNKEIAEKAVIQGFLAKEIQALYASIESAKQRLGVLNPPVQTYSMDSLTLMGRIGENANRIIEATERLKVLENEDLVEIQVTKDQISVLQNKIANTLKDPSVVGIEDQIRESEAVKVVLVEKTMTLNRQISDIKVNSHKRVVLERSIFELSEFLETTDVGVCPTCSQMWDSHALIQAKRTELAVKEWELSELPVLDLETIIAEEKDVKAKLKDEDRKVKELRIEKVAIIESLQKSLLSKVNELQTIPTKCLPAIINAKLELHKLSNEKVVLLQEQNTALLKQNEYDKALLVYQTNRKNVESQIEAMEQQKVAKDIENSAWLQSIAFLNEKVDFTKGFLYNIFHDMLEELTQETNAILTKIPNVAHITVNFSSERVTGKGELKQELVAKINVNGTERPLKAGCSGGMISAVQLAIDLALRRLLSRRAQKDWGILMIDEQFSGLDLVSKTCCMEVLKDFSQNCLVMVIDHHTEINEYSDQIIEVEYQNGRSYIA